MGQNIERKIHETLKEVWIDNGMPGEWMVIVTLQVSTAKITLSTTN